MPLRKWIHKTTKFFDTRLYDTGSGVLFVGYDHKSSLFIPGHRLDDENEIVPIETSDLVEKVVGLEAEVVSLREERDEALSKAAQIRTVAAELAEKGDAIVEKSKFEIARLNELVKVLRSDIAALKARNSLSVVARSDEGALSLLQEAGAVSIVEHGSIKAALGLCNCEKCLANDKRV